MHSLHFITRHLRPVADMDVKTYWDDLANRSSNIRWQIFYIYIWRPNSVCREWLLYLHAHVSSFETAWVSLSFLASVFGCAGSIRPTAFSELNISVRCANIERIASSMVNYFAISCTANVHYVYHDWCIKQCIHYAILHTAVKKGLFQALFPHQ